MSKRHKKTASEVILASGKYDEWLVITGMSYQTLRDIASVAKNIPLSARGDNLDFTHHRMIAAKAFEVSSEHTPCLLASTPQRTTKSSHVDMLIFCISHAETFGKLLLDVRRSKALALKHRKNWPQIKRLAYSDVREHRGELKL